MEYFIIYDKKTGFIDQCLSIPKEHLVKSRKDMSYLEVNFETFNRACESTCFIFEDILIPAPRRPSPFHTFNIDTKTWEDSRPLEDVKKDIWERLKQIRIEKEHNGFIYKNVVFDSDLNSQMRIFNAILYGEEVTWTLKDNSEFIIYKEDLIPWGSCLRDHLNNIHLDFKKVRDKIYSSTSYEALALIDVTNY